MFLTCIARKQKIAMDTKVGSEIHGPKPVGTEPEPKKLRNIDQIGSEPEQFSNLGPNCPRTMLSMDPWIGYRISCQI